MKRRIDTQASRTAELTCICRAASSLETNACYKSDDTTALRLLPALIKTLIQIPFYRMLHCKVGAPKGIYEYIIARTKYIDAVFREAAAEGFIQVVILGAGFDTRAIRLLGKEANTTVFELDARFTQQAKLDLYRKNNIPIPPGVRFISIDFNEESLDPKLAEVGFDRSQRSLFIMEGLVMYLEPSAARKMFQTITEQMAPNSRLVFDYVYASVLRREKIHYGETEIVKSVSGVHESWQFGIEKDAIKDFLSGNALVLRNHMSAQDIEETYFKDEHGRIIAHVNGAHCLVLAEKI